MFISIEELYSYLMKNGKESGKEILPDSLFPAHPYRS